MNIFFNNLLFDLQILFVQIHKYIYYRSNINGTIQAIRQITSSLTKKI